MTNKKYAPVKLVTIGLIVILSFTVIHGATWNIFIRSLSFTGNMLSVIVLCNVAYKKGLEKDR